MGLGLDVPVDIDEFLVGLEVADGFEPRGEGGGGEIGCSKVETALTALSEEQVDQGGDGLRDGHRVGGLWRAGGEVGRGNWEKRFDSKSVYVVVLRFAGWGRSVAAGQGGQRRTKWWGRRIGRENGWMRVQWLDELVEGGQAQKIVALGKEGGGSK